MSILCSPVDGYCYWRAVCRVRPEPEGPYRQKVSKMYLVTHRSHFGRRPDSSRGHVIAQVSLANCSTTSA